jgi:uncharacterized membrane protein
MPETDSSPVPQAWPRWVVPTATLVGPVALFALLFLLAFLVYNDGQAYRVVWLHMVALFTTPFGKFVAIGMLRAGFGVLPTTFFLGSIELCFALFFVFNFDLVYRIPRVGRWVRKAEAKGHVALGRRAWIRRLAFTGIFVYTVIPFQGTGAIVAAIFGRLLGLGRLKSVVAIAAGGYAGIFLVSVTAVGLGYAYRAGLDWGLYSTLLLVTVVYTLWAGFWNPYRPPQEPGRSP